MDALRQVNYGHALSIRFWKTQCEDEGVRAICQYAKQTPGIKIIELLDNEITVLGCEFLSKILAPEAKMNL